MSSQKEEATILTHPAVLASKSDIHGTILYQDGTPAAEATVAITDLDSGLQIATVSAGADGRIRATIPKGEYSLTATTERESIWIEKQTLTDDDFTVKLIADCEAISGHIINPDKGKTQVTFERHGINTGDMFVTIARSDGSFRACLPRAEYTVRLRGAMLATGIGLSMPTTAPLELQGYSSSEIRTSATVSDRIPHSMNDLIADIERMDAKVIGLGEATHGSAEFFTKRAQLTLELAHRARLRTILLEVDAIAAIELERYARGDDTDLAKAVSVLGYWTIDTYEFWQFMRDLRAYNKSIANEDAHIHIWGIDAQDTERPVALLLSRTQSLALSRDDQDLLSSIGPARAKAIKQFTPARRAALDALLARLSIPMSASETDTQSAVAARSLVTQVGYMDGDTLGLYASRRDEGMARLASFIISRSNSSRACLWAHADHISRTAESGLSMGQRLAREFRGQYYAIGFYLHEGSSRAWDSAGKIGVISHRIPPAPAFTAEGVLLAATAAKETAWIPLFRLPEALKRWFKIPRFVRELGAVYMGEERSMILLNIPSAFNGIVLIRVVQDSSPTPTGVRHKS